MQQINVNELKSHPRNNEFFDDMTGEKWNEFLESVKTRGIIEPIVITPDKVIVSGHQRIRACKELGITTVMCDVHTYNNEDEVLQDLLETNIRQRGDVGGSAKKVGLRIKELERIYGIKHGGLRSNETQEASGHYVHLTQEDLAKEMNMSVKTLNRYKKISEMIPELEELVDTETVTPTTALAIMKNLSEEEQLKLISSLDTTKKITQKQVQRYIDRIQQLEARTPEIIDKTDYALIAKLEKKLKEVETQKSTLEKKIESDSENVERANKLQADIERLLNEKSDLGRKIDAAEKTAEMTARIGRVFDSELAFLEYEDFMQYLDEDDVCTENIVKLLAKIDKWSFKIKALLPGAYKNIVDVQDVQ